MMQRRKIKINEAERDHDMLFKSGSLLNTSFGFNQFSSNIPPQPNKRGFESVISKPSKTTVSRRPVQNEIYQGPSQFATMKRKRNKLKPVATPNGPRSRFAVGYEEEEEKHEDDPFAVEMGNDAWAQGDGPSIPSLNFPTTVNPMPEEKTIKPLDLGSKNSTKASVSEELQAFFLQKPDDNDAATAPNYDAKESEHLNWKPFSVSEEIAAFFLKTDYENDVVTVPNSDPKELKLQNSTSASVSEEIAAFFLSKGTDSNSDAKADVHVSPIPAISLETYNDLSGIFSAPAIQGEPLPLIKVEEPPKEIRLGFFYEFDE